MSRSVDLWLDLKSPVLYYLHLIRHHQEQYLAANCLPIRYRHILRILVLLSLRHRNRRGS